MLRTLSQTAVSFSAVGKLWRNYLLASRLRLKTARDIAHLESLPDTLLKDIGVTRHDVMRGRLPTR